MKMLQAAMLVTILFLGCVTQTWANISSSEKISAYERELGDMSVRSKVHNMLPSLGIRDFSSGEPETDSSMKASLYADLPAVSALEIRPSNNPAFDYQATSPYYKASFKDGTVRITLAEGWVELTLKEKKLTPARATDVGTEELSVDQISVSAIENSIFISHVFESTDLSYTVEASLIREALTLNRFIPSERFIQEISWQGLAPEFQEDGSIIFFSGKPVLRILPPSMTDAQGSTCSDLHYELVEAEKGHQLHKVIDEKGLEWLQKAVYPVVIDPSMETFEDAWESSGLTPYGEYFKNLQERVNIGNGHLVIMQTDLTIQGRGPDLVISRLYETPAVFFQADPYDYTPPPVSIGKGWRLNFPYIAGGYLYYWGGTIFKITWTNNTFENHLGSHFILVKNADNTYTLTRTNGTVCEFNTAGNITEIKDVDQNTISFNYTGNLLTSITDTIGRVVTLSYSGGYLQMIIYNGAEIEYSVNGQGNLVWVEDFLNRRTSYYYNTGWTEYFCLVGDGCFLKENVHLLSKIVYPTGGYTTYEYNRFSYEDIYGDDGTPLDFYAYYVTHQRAYETSQERHSVYSFSGNFNFISDCIITVRNGIDVAQEIYDFDLDTVKEVVTQIALKNPSGTPIQKHKFVYNSRKETIQTEVYNDGTTLSYTNYYAYDNWGNLTYSKDAGGHERFFSYANTSTSGFFIDNTGAVIRDFTNAFSNSSVPSSVHVVLLGAAEKQDGTYVKEVYVTYDSEAHPTQIKNSFGNYTTYLTFSGTFNEKTGTTSFPINLTGHTVTGNAVLQMTGLSSDDTYTESHSYGCPCGNPTVKCTWTSGYWSGPYYNVHWAYGNTPEEMEEGWASVGPFTHYPNTLGYLSYTTNPPLGGKSTTFTVTTTFRAYPAQVQYNLDGTPWKTVTANLGNSTATMTAPITDGSHTLNFSESSSYKTKFSWTLYVPVDNAPDTFIKTFAFDTYGNITQATDYGGHNTTFEYSAEYGYAFVTKITDALGISATATYDPATGKILSITDPKGNVTTYQYDLLGRITKRINPDLSESEAVYDDSTLCVTMYDELDHYTKMYYDNLGRLKEVEHYMGGQLYATEEYTYNYANMVTAYTDPLGHVYSYEYDIKGRLTRKTNPDSTFTTTQYDDTTNVITSIDENSHKKQEKFDWKERLLWVKEYTDEQTYYFTECAYDQAGNVLTVTDARGNTTTFEYHSPFGRTETTFPDSTTETYVYDVMGNLVSYTDADGNIFTYLYNAVSQPTEIQYPDETSITFEYDTNGNQTRMVDPSGVSTYSYDNRNRLTSETRTINGTAYTVSLEYDAASQTTAMTYPEGTRITFVYDDLGRLISIPGYADFSYDAGSQVENIVYANGVHMDISYSVCCGQPTRFLATKSGTTLLDLVYTYDSADNIVELEKHVFNPETQILESSTDQYSYDWLNRLVSATGDFGSYSYSYDSTGNRVSFNGTQYTYNSMNELVSMSDGTAFTYDQKGNMISKVSSLTWEYQYDYTNRLTEVKRDGQIIGQYTYDGSGKRIQKTEWLEPLQAFQSTLYLYSGTDVMYEKNIDTEMDAIYIYGPTGRIAKKTDTATYYYLNDRLNSPRLITDEDGSVISAIDYRPFGENEQEGAPENYLFNGKEKDASQLYYYGARYYDPTLGRFITRDPLKGVLEEPQSLNQYTYCLNNPLRYSDPWGEEADEECECTYEVSDLLDELDFVDNEIAQTQHDLEEAEYRLEQAKKRVETCDKIEPYLDIFEPLSGTIAFTETPSPSAADWIKVLISYYIHMYCNIQRSAVKTEEWSIGVLKKQLVDLQQYREQLIGKIKEQCYCALEEDSEEGSNSSGTPPSLPRYIQPC